jgi:hypothetical protein
MATAKKAAKQITLKGVKIDPEKAVKAALKALENPAVREGLSRASVLISSWASEIRRDHQRRQQQKAVAPPKPEEHEDGEGFMARFGQRGLERRVTELRKATNAAFTSPADEGRVELEQALDSVERYLAVVAGMPLVKRKPAHWKADNMLDALERGLVEAVDPT